MKASRSVQGRKQRLRGAAMAAAAIGLIGATGCGLRVPNSELRSADAAAVGQGSGSQSGIGPGSSASQSGAYQALSSGSRSNSSGSKSSTGSQSALQQSSSAQQAGSSGPTASSAGSATGSGGGGAGSQAPAGGNGGATDVGVTATSITVANVSDLGGPVPGLFQGGPYGVQAYFDYINSQGGVYGRQLKLNSVDDSLDCGTNEARYSDLVGKVFAFVGSWSLDDNCGAQVMAQHPNIPEVQTYLSPQAAGLPNAYAISPYTPHFYLGPYLYFKQKYGSAIEKVGTIVGNQPAAVASWNHLRSAITSIGYGSKDLYVDEFPPAQTNFTADVLTMKAHGDTTVIINQVNLQDAAIFASEAAQQGYHPTLWNCPVCYGAGYQQDAGGNSAVNGQYANINTADFLGDPGVPEVALYQQWLHSAYAQFSPDEFSAYSWANAALFVHAVQQVGPNLTQKGLLAALAGTTSFTDHGMVSTANIAHKQASLCYTLLQIVNGQWTKVNIDPASGFRCDGYFAG